MLVRVCGIIWIGCLCYSNVALISSKTNVELGKVCIPTKLVQITLFIMYTNLLAALLSDTACYLVVPIITFAISCIFFPYLKKPSKFVSSKCIMLNLYYYYIII